MSSAAAPQAPAPAPAAQDAAPPADCGQRRGRFHRLLPATVLLAALIIAWAPLAVPETIAGQSTMSDRIRAEAIHAAVAGGDLLPAWLPDLYDRHGTPLPSFYAPLSYAVVELLRRVSGGLESAFRLAYLFFWIVGAAGASLAARRRFGPDSAIPAAAAFALAPYVLVDAYVRCGIAEFAALALLPWALAALVSAGSLAWIGTAVAVALLVLTHNITALIAVPVLALLALFGPAHLRRRAFTGIALGLALSTFFWLPALVETRWLWSENSLTTGFFDYRRHFVAPLDLLPGRTSLQFTIGLSTGMPFRLGEPLLLAAAAAFAFAGLRRLHDRRAALLLASGTAAALLLTSSLSEPIWRALPLMHYVQFPFRFFLFATVLAAPLVGWLVAQAPTRWRAPAAALMTALALWVAQPWIEARYFFIDLRTALPVPVLASELERARHEPRFRAAARWVTLDRLRSEHWSGSAGSAFLPRTVTELPAEATGKVPTIAAEPLAAGIRVLASDWGYPEVRAEIEVLAAGELALHQFWFPGWRATVDGAPREVRAEPGRGRLVLDVRPGDRLVRARFGPTLWRQAAGAASLLALAGAFMRLWILRRRGPAARHNPPPAGGTV